MKKPLIVIAGPTASGKSGVSVELAKKINGEIISGDSMQVYKLMDIGTAKITPQEMQGVQHYMIDELFPDDEFNVAVFQNMANKYLETIFNKNKVPILCGGTGFYINSLVYNNNFTETKNDFDYRNRLYALAEEKGAVYIHEMLEKIDKVSSENIHPNNIKRTVRALEYYHLTGEKISNHNDNERKKVSPYNTTFVVLHMDRKILYEKIERRIDEMLASGLVDEIKLLLDRGYTEELVSMQAIGYKEMIPYIKGHQSLEAAVFELKKATRHFAKRQLTWFRHNAENAVWIDVYGKSRAEIAGEIISNFKFIS